MWDKKGENVCSDRELFSRSAALVRGLADGKAL